jgi:hypothetical protein
VRSGAPLPAHPKGRHPIRLLRVSLVPILRVPEPEGFGQRGVFMTFADHAPRPGVEAGEVIVIEVGGEGGSLTIVGTKGGERLALPRHEGRNRPLRSSQRGRPRGSDISGRIGLG